MDAWRALSDRDRRGLALWFTLVGVLATLGLGVAGRLHQTDIAVSGTAAAKADGAAGRAFGASSSGLVLVTGPRALLDAHGPAVAARLRSLRDVRVLDPWQTGDPALRPAPSKALLVLNVAEPYERASGTTDERIRRQLRAFVRPPLAAHMSGYIDIGNQVHRESVRAIERAELIAAPMLVIALLVVLGSPIAASLPLGLGMGVVGASTGVLSLINTLRPLDVTALNLASMMGLALGVDYALLIVTRFREEIASGRSVNDAAAATAASAGRTVRFAALVLALVMVTSLVLQPGAILSSAVVGTLVAVGLSVLGASLGMPPLLRLFGHGVNRWMLVSAGAGSSRWGAGALRLIRRPGLAVAFIGVAMLALAVPALAMHTGPPNPLILPKETSARKDFDAIRRHLNGGWSAPYQVTFIAPRGTLTTPQRLHALAAFQRRLQRDRRVYAVLGPAAVARQTAALASVPAQLQQGAAAVQQGQQGLGRLDRGLVQAAAGVQQLLSGLGSARGGAAALGQASSSGEAGAAQLESGLAAAGGGASALHRGLEKVATGLGRLQQGQLRAAGGAGRIDGSLREIASALKLAGPQVAALARQLASGGDALEALVAPAELTQRQLAAALVDLKRMSPSAQLDPAYARVYREVATADAAVSGRDPRTGASVRAGYAGLPASLSQAAANARAGSAAVERIRSGLARMASGLSALQHGTDRLQRATTALARGASRLRAGQATAAASSGQLVDGASRLSGGATQLENGISRLAAGNSRLANGLAGAVAQAEPLEGGLASLAGGARTGAAATGQLAGRLHQAGSLGALLRSGYATAAALDEAPPAERSNAQAAVNVDRGASAVRLLVVARNVSFSTPNPFLGWLRHASTQVGRGVGADAAVGGPAADLTDFDGATRARLPLLIAAILVVAYLALVPVLRSLILPLVAVALNLLTVLAAFGVLSACFSVGTPGFSGGAPLGGPGFVDDIMVISVFSIVFALSIDYEVFLLSRMREGWLATGSTRGAISHGVQHTAGVITGAAAIMCAVFFAFALSSLINLRELGLGLTVAVILDATVIRLVALPAVLQLIGDRAWTLPAWLERRLRTPAVQRARATEPAANESVSGMTPRSVCAR